MSEPLSELQTACEVTERVLAMITKRLVRSRNGMTYVRQANGSLRRVILKDVLFAAQRDARKAARVTKGKEKL